jgi:NTE family protein
MALRPAGPFPRWTLLLCLLAPAAAMAEAPAGAGAETAPSAASGAVAAAPIAPGHDRPRVAIVLSGGGARGLAHVGVFKALQKLRIPYDCIVGTSMGAIAGGTFATGQPVADVEHKVVTADWDAVFADRARRSDVPYFRKAEDYRPYVDFTVTFASWRPLAPRNFVGVQHIGLFFRELTGAQSAADFDDLPVPFRAVGTDIVSGKAVILDQGTVAEAMRASMTVPGLFPPIPYKGHLLVDGGLANNIPVSIGQELCGDVVIAVNAASPNLRADQLDSLFSIGEQVINISMMANMDAEIAKLRPQDVLLVPDLHGFAGGDFEKVEAIIRRGELAVEEQAERLRPLQLDEAGYAAWRRRIEARKAPPPLIDRVVMADMRWVNPDVMSDLLRLRPGQPFDLEALHRNIGRVYARGDFSQISYDLLATEPGKAELHITPEEKPGRDFLRFGLGLYTDFSGDARFNAMASLRRAWLNRLDGQWRTDLRVGRDLELFSEWYQPMSLGSELFVAPQVFYSDQFRDLRFSSPTRFEYEYARTGAALEIGSVFGRWGEVRAGVVHAYASAELSAGPLLPEQSWHQGGYTLRSVYDQLDSTWFPHRGGSARISYFRSSDDMGADLDYERLEVRALRAFGWRDNTLLLSLRGGSSLESTLPFYDAFGLGGIFNLSAYPNDYYLGGEMALGGLQWYRRIGQMPSGFGRGVYAGVGLEAAHMTDIQPGYAAPEGAVSGNVFLAADTVLGPFYLLAAAGDRKQRALYMALGISF